MFRLPGTHGVLPATVFLHPAPHLYIYILVLLRSGKEARMRQLNDIEVKGLRGEMARKRGDMVARRRGIDEAKRPGETRTSR